MMLQWLSCHFSMKIQVNLLKDSPSWAVNLYKSSKATKELQAASLIDASHDGPVS